MLSLFKFLVSVVPCLLCVAFFTLLERKVLGIVGYRLGPYKVSLGGFLQPIGDAGKLMNKEVNSLSNFSSFFYYLSSAFMLFSSVFLLFMLCSNPQSLYVISSVLLILIFLAFNSLNSIISGWSINTKFSLLGSIRTVSQLVSYEVLLYMCLFFFFFLYFSFDLDRYVFFNFDFFFFCSPLLFFIWLLSVLAELNRSPYDFSEGESELVSGFNIDYGSSSFTLIFLAEYGNIFFFMYLSSFLFFSSFTLFYSFIFFFLVIWLRSIVPRYRFDKLMNLSWKCLFPQLSFFFVLFFVLLY